MTFTAPNRKDTRDDVYALMNTIAGAGEILQAVINGTPDGDVAGQTPLLVVMSGGGYRPALRRGTAQNNNQFTMVLIALVSQQDPNADDTLDDVEQAISHLMSQNRSTDDWQFIDYSAPSIVGPATYAGHPYLSERFEITVTVWG